MALRYKLLQIIGCAKMWINIIEVLLPVAMVSFISLFRNWRYPDRICSKTLDVVQFLNYSLKATPTEIGEVLTWSTGITRFSKTIS